MTRIYKVPFATTSDKRETLATTEQPDGKVSLTTGWTSVYELENDNPSYKPVGRGEMNGILGEITEGIGELQLQGGVIRWRAIDGGFNKGAIVYGADMQTMWQSTIDSNTTDPDSVGTKGWSKIVDSAGLVKFMSDRFAFVYPNGGSEASPANITVNQRYVIPSPFPGHQFYSVPEIFYNNMWGDPKFIWYLANTTTATGIGAATSQVSDNIILVTGALGFLGTPNHQGHPFVGRISSLTSVPCRIKVWRVD